MMTTKDKGLTSGTPNKNKELSFVKYRAHSIHVVRSYNNCHWFNAVGVLSALGVRKCEIEGDSAEADSRRARSPLKEGDAVSKRLLSAVGGDHVKALRDVVVDGEGALYGNSKLAASYIDVTGIRVLVGILKTPTAEEFFDFVQRDLVHRGEGMSPQERDTHASGDRETKTSRDMERDFGIGPSQPHPQLTVQIAAEVRKSVDDVLCRMASNEAALRDVKEQIKQIRHESGEGVFRMLNEHWLMIKGLKDELRELVLGVKEGLGRRPIGGVPVNCAASIFSNDLCVEMDPNKAREMGEAEQKRVNELVRALSYGGQRGEASFKLEPLDETDRWFCETINRGARKLTLSNITLNMRDLKLIAKCTSIVQLNLRECRGLCYLQTLTGAVSLRELHLEVDGEVRDLDALRKLPSLKVLHLHYPSMTEDEFGCLGTLDNIEELLLCCALNVKCLEPLANLSRLRVLDMCLPVDMDGSQRVQCATCACSLGGRRSPLADVGPLSGVKTLEELRLAGCPEVAGGFDVICALPKLRVLDLRSTGVTNGCVAGLSGSRSLVKLDLSWCKGVTDITPLSCVLTLEELNLRWCANLTHGIGVLGELPRLRVLDLCGTGVTNGCLAGLCDSGSLAVLDLSWCNGLTDATLLAEIKTLEELQLRRCNNLKDGLATLGELSALRGLDLCGLGLSDSCLRGLSESKSLATLNLSWCDNLTNMSSLSQVKTLETLSVMGCKNLKEGFGAIGSLPRLQVLRMYCARISDENVASLSACKNLTRVNLQDCNDVVDIGLLSHIKTLEELSVQRCVKLAKGFETLGSLPNLRLLHMRDVGATDKLFEGLGASRSLVTLHLDKCDSLLNMSSLSGAKTLEILNAVSCKNLKRGLGALGALPRLRVLILHASGITDSCLRDFSSSGSLVTLQLGNCDTISDVGPLSQIKTLEELELVGCRSLTKGVGTLGGLPKLRALCLQGAPISDGNIASLNVSKSLMKLDIRDCENLVDVSSLSRIPALEELVINRCMKLTEGFDSLSSLSRLRSLDLRGMGITDRNLRGLSTCEGLRRLDISHCPNLSDISPVANIKTLEKIQLYGSDGVCKGFDELLVLPKLREIGSRNPGFGGDLTAKYNKKGVYVRHF